MSGSFGRGIALLIRSRRVASASDVVREALRLLEPRDRDDAWLRQKMADAEEQVRRGEVVEMTGTF
ncbi:MAG: type II toxin-antitoxin system ParD family antitoxin [Chloroflexia bacterium]|nr:type II toxin-antitoxin system ParD family antitoxin [Chloroflexia bacterium]